MKRLKLPPYAPNLSDDEKRVRHNIRLLNQGFRMFRFDTPRGNIVQVESVDLDAGMAYGKGLRGRNRKALLSNIYPMHYKEQ